MGLDMDVSLLGIHGLEQGVLGDSIHARRQVVDKLINSSLDRTITMQLIDPHAVRVWQ